MKYKKALQEYLATNIATRHTSNAAKFLDTFNRPKSKIISVDEVRANATIEGLKNLESLEFPCAPRIRDAFKLIQEKEWDELAAHKLHERTNNRPFARLTLRQTVGSCGSEGISGAIMMTEEKQGQESEKLNAYALYGRVNGGRDNGSSPSDNVAAAIKYGIPSECVWPRSHGWRSKLSDEAITDALNHRPVEIFRVSDKIEYGTALFSGFAVYSGYRGHAWFGVDVLDTKRLLYKDSQGPDYGDDGFIVLKWSEIYWPYGAWAIRTAVRSS